MTHNEAVSMVEQMKRPFVEKRRLLLIVDVENEEAAEQIIKWMYSEIDKPMSAKLLEVSWDKAVVSAKLVDAISQLRSALIECI